MIDKKDKVHGKSFVIIGGDVQLINSVERMLLFAGATVKACTTGFKGISEMRNIRPDILILENSVPDMDASEIIQTLQNDDLTMKIPTIVISDLNSAETYKKLFTHGIQDYIPKSDFDVMQVILRIEAILRKTVTADKKEVFDFSESDKNVTKTRGAHLVKLLIVEDDPLLQNLLLIRLQKNKIDHRFCNSGSDALAAVLDYKPTVVLLDLMLPGKDGMDVLAEIRKNKEVSSTKVIIFSNKDDDEERAKANKLGVSDFLVKATTDLGDLIALIVTKSKE